MSYPTIRFGFVSTRFAGTDGVSLEASKWCDVLEDLGHQCYFFAGECDRPEGHSRVVPEAHFEFPLVQRINADLFDKYTRSAETSEAIHDLWRVLTRALRDFINDFNLQVLVVENALSLPMNIPLAVALTEAMVEHNYALGRKHYSYSVLKKRLQTLIDQCFEQIS